MQFTTVMSIICVLLGWVKCHKFSMNTNSTKLDAVVNTTQLVPVGTSALASKTSPEPLLSTTISSQNPMLSNIQSQPNTTSKRSTNSLFNSYNSGATTKAPLSQAALLEQYGLNPASNVLSVYMADFLSSLTKEQMTSFFKVFFYQQQALIMGISDMHKTPGFSKTVESARSVINLKRHLDGFRETGLAQILATMSQQLVAASVQQRADLLQRFEQEIRLLKAPEGLKSTLRAVLEDAGTLVPDTDLPIQQKQQITSTTTHPAANATQQHKIKIL